MKRQEGKLESNLSNTRSNTDTGTGLDQRGQNVGEQTNVVAENVVFHSTVAWHAVTSSNLRWLSRFFTVLIFVILFIWLASELDLRAVKLGIFTLDFSAIKPGLTNIGIRFEPLYLLLSSIVSIMFALFTWRLSRINGASKERYYQHVPPKLLSSINNPAFQLSNTDLRKARSVILKHVKSKLNFQGNPLDFILIEMQAAPDAIKPAVQSAWPSIQKPIRTADITVVFNLHDTVLLLLGEPGSGKTTMLYKLCQHLYEQAVQDKTATVPIPVVLSLTSWIRRSSIEDWLIDSVSTEYGCKRHFVKPLIEEGIFIFLLDELDQVPVECRTQCIDALNAFCKESLGPVVICCRIQEYYQLPTKIAAAAAYQLLPLTPEQIDQYLRAVGPESTYLQTLIKINSELNELVRTPSILNIIILGATAPLMSPSSEKLKLQQQIFDQYILSRFSSQAENSQYTPTKTIRWLRWQAQRMFEFHINIFCLEHIQPAWLVPNNQQHPLLSLVFNSRFRKIVKTLLPFISKNGTDSTTVPPYTDISWQWRSAATKLREGFVTGFNLGCWPVVFLGLFLGILVALLGGLAVTVPRWVADFNVVKPIVDLVTNKDSLFWLSIPPIIGTVLGAIVGIPLGTLVSGPLLGILSGLLGGVASANITKMTRPSQSLRRSGWFGLIAGTSIGLITAIGFGLIAGLLTNSSLGLITGICLGTIVGTYAALTSGGAAFLVHYMLRYLLYLNNDIPLRYVHFLEYAYNRVFLYRTGPGYIFAHRMLLEHFANLTDKDIERIAAEIDARTISQRTEGGRSHDLNI